MHEKLAQLTAVLYTPDPQLSHVSSGGNEVYRLLVNGRPHYLRLTSPHMRRQRENEAECAFVDYLFQQSVPVARPVLSLKGRFVEAVNNEGEIWLASVFTEAPGVIVKAGDAHWQEPFFREWGRVLGQMHQAARGYEGDARWQWHEELWLPDAERNQIRRWLLAGYESVLPIAPEMLAELDWFLRLRMIYVYLLRLWWFGERPSRQQQQILDRLRHLVHHPVTWDNIQAPTWRI